MSLEQKQSLENLQQLLCRQIRDISAARLIALIHWVSAANPNIPDNPEGKSSSTGMFDLDKDPDPGGPLDPGPSVPGQKAELRP